MTRPVDARGRKVAVVCHCILNANTKVEGLSQYAGIHPLVTRLAELGIGVIQMPCAEMTALGMRRWGQTREQYESVAFTEHCRVLSEQTAEQVREFARCGYEIVGLVGVDGSPTCGVTFSASGEWGGEPSPEEWAKTVSTCGKSDKPGVHIEILQQLLKPLGVRFTAIDESVPGHGVDEVVEALTGKTQESR
jgi:predicted secreted protein